MSTDKKLGEEPEFTSKQEALLRAGQLLDALEDPDAISGIDNPTFLKEMFVALLQPGGKGGEALAQVIKEGKLPASTLGILQNALNQAGDSIQEGQAETGRAVGATLEEKTPQRTKEEALAWIQEQGIDFDEELKFTGTKCRYRENMNPATFNKGVELMLAEIMTYYGGPDDSITRQEIIDSFTFGWSHNRGDIKEFSNDPYDKKLQIAELGKMAQEICELPSSRLPSRPSSIFLSSFNKEGVFALRNKDAKGVEKEIEKVKPEDPEEYRRMRSFAGKLINAANLLRLSGSIDYIGDYDRVTEERILRITKDYRDAMGPSLDDNSTAKLDSNGLFSIGGFVNRVTRDIEKLDLRDDVSEDTKEKLKKAKKRLDEAHARYAEHKDDYSYGEAYYKEKGDRDRKKRRLSGIHTISVNTSNEDNATVLADTMDVLTELLEANMEGENSTIKEKTEDAVNKANEAIDDANNKLTTDQLTTAKHERQVANFQSALPKVVEAIDQVINKISKIKYGPFKKGRLQKLNWREESGRAMLEPIRNTLEEAVDLFQHPEMSSEELATGRVRIKGQSFASVQLGDYFKSKFIDTTHDDRIVLKAGNEHLPIDLSNEVIEVTRKVSDFAKIVESRVDNSQYTKLTFLNPSVLISRILGRHINPTYSFEDNRSVDKGTIERLIEALNRVKKYVERLGNSDSLHQTQYEVKFGVEGPFQDEYYTENREITEAALRGVVFSPQN